MLELDAAVLAPALGRLVVGDRDLGAEAPRRQAPVGDAALDQVAPDAVGAVVGEALVPLVGAPGFVWPSTATCSISGVTSRMRATSSRTSWLSGRTRDFPATSFTAA